jgi:hypothetical protein
MKFHRVQLVPYVFALGVACDHSLPQPAGALGGASSSIWPSLVERAHGGDESDNPWLHPLQGSGGAEAAEPPRVGPSGGRNAQGSLLSPGGSSSDPISPGGVDGASGGAPPLAPPDLRIVRYIEGQTSEKQLWLSNLGRSTQTGECEVVIYSNGSTKPYRRHLLPGLPVAAEFRLCTAAAPVACEGSLGSSSFNGNDAIVLACAGVPVDSFGRLGEDPGKGWLGVELSSTDTDLLRCGEEPDITPTDAFVIHDAWALTPAEATWSDALRGCEQKNLGGSGSN